ncbi:CBO0543 family protein [Bacillus sp. 3255]|uniref:CBO0543 family protein n=1 Tax=Bacillus sp. 3255 TaxID=2817904 RepID=UPI00286349E6|nr:CBO0543 family protein [Bacillus sp. 3255]MDR6882881.1 cell division protein FtsW (lipid II flippase) [Bacillus sp. 3255]
MNNKIEYSILLAVWAIALTGLLLVPKRHRRKAQVAFLFQQFICWILGLIVVQNNWLDYPVRELKRNYSSLTFEFIAYPAIAVYLNIYYPAMKTKWTRLLFVLAFPAAITVVEIILEKNTELIDYHSWSWYWTFASILVTLGLSLVFNRWFFREGKSAAGETS